MIPRQKPNTRAPMLVAAAALGVLAIGGAGILFAQNMKSDDLSPQEAQQRADGFKGTLSLPPVPASERDAAYQSMVLTPEQEKLLRQDVEDGKTKLVWFTIWDDQVEDGDQVQVSSGGYSVDLNLYSQPARLGMVLGADGLTITGIGDGGGGITMGIQETGSVAYTPVLALGQSFKIGWR